MALEVKTAHCSVPHLRPNFPPGLGRRPGPPSEVLRLEVSGNCHYLLMAPIVCHKYYFCCQLPLFVHFSFCFMTAAFVDLHIDYSSPAGLCYFLPEFQWYGSGVQLLCRLTVNLQQQQQQAFPHLYFSEQPIYEENQISGFLAQKLFSGLLRTPCVLNREDENRKEFPANPTETVCQFKQFFRKGEAILSARYLLFILRMLNQGF